MKAIALRELRNHSGEILRQAESGQQFAITVDSRPVAVLGPYQKRQWVPKGEILKVLRSQPPDPTFFEDLEMMGGMLEDSRRSMEELSRGLLDTSVLIAREEDSRLESSLPQEIAISVVTLAELHFGVLVAKEDETRQLRLRRLGIIEATLQPIPIDAP
jgi:prevent-host-death family protein